MAPAQGELDTQTLLRGYVELQQHALSHLKSMALACATGLGIPSAIHRRGGAATISDLIADTGLPDAKLPYLRRLMRVLTVSGIVGSDQRRRPSSLAGGEDDDDTVVYTLTPVCRVLVHGGAGNDTSSASSCDMSALLRLLTRPSTTLAPFFNLEAWFRDDEGSNKTAFEMVHGMSPWSLTKKDASFNKTLNDACVADSSMTIDALLRVTGSGAGENNIFQGLTSLVDVGGGHGAAAIAIARAFPHIKCSVLDLEQVISEAPEDDTVQFIAGDMFQSIPPADAVLLKGVLNCWDEDDCVKILKMCKEAIPARDAGGKVIIVNMVVGYGTPDIAVREAQVLVDLYLMRAGGIERDEREWKNVFMRAGFSGYKIMPILGTMSVIEVFP